MLRCSSLARFMTPAADDSASSGMSMGLVSIPMSILALAVVVPNDAQGVTTELVASGLDRPTYVTAPPGDLDRVFITGQGGRIVILRDGTVLGTPFLDITDKVNDNRSERGLFSVAFHPDYAQNGFFYVDYTGGDGQTVVERYTVSGDPDVADAASGFQILTINQPFNNHNGGQLAFGPNDGLLYISTGDGGSGGDPDNRAQTLGDLLGKLLRIDVDGSSPYAIPADNPFVGLSEARPEIYAYGLRNPYRFSFDMLTGDLYLADVGQNDWEEVNFKPAASTGGQNYGWRVMEGLHCFNPPTGCDMTGLDLPVHEYANTGLRCAIIGGFVYRGSAVPEFEGLYFLADYCSGEIFTFRMVNGQVTEVQERSAELAPGGGVDLGFIASFGQDPSGEIYLCDQRDGEVFKIVAGSSGGGTDGGGSSGGGMAPAGGGLCGFGIIETFLCCMIGLVSLRRVAGRRPEARGWRP